MKIRKTLSACILVMVAAACGSAKKSTSSASAVPATTPASTNTATVPSSDSYLFGNPAEGKHAPGDKELAAIQLRFADATLEKLKEGHAIYTTGACVGCHGTVNIYQYDEVQWKLIIDDMSSRANISDAEKDAVYKYVLAIKATQPK